jgi:hypothetical protein
LAIANPQERPGAHRNIRAAISDPSKLTVPVTADRPAKAEKQPAAPPIAMFQQRGSRQMGKEQVVVVCFALTAIAVLVVLRALLTR